MSKVYSFDQLTDSVELLEKKPPRFIARFLYFLVMTLCIFMLWAYFGKIDIVSIGTGLVKGESDLHTSHAQVSGRVENLFFKPGDEVQKGSPIIQLKSNDPLNSPTINAPQSGIVHFHSTLQKGDLVDMNQEVFSIIPKESEKKVKILLPAQELKDIQVGDNVNYSFNLESTNSQSGTITYISPYPNLDENSNMYMYELEGTIDSKEIQNLHIGMTGPASIVTHEEHIWKFILRELGLLSLH